MYDNTEQSFEAVYSAHWGGALRDGTKNGCLAD